MVYCYHAGLFGTEIWKNLVSKQSLQWYYYREGTSPARYRVKRKLRVSNQRFQELCKRIIIAIIIR